MALSAVVLAAGAASRFGRPKQLERWPPFNGPTLVERAVTLAATSGVVEVVVVTGNESTRVANLINGQTFPVPVRTVINTRWREGQGFSVAAGVKALEPECQGALFFLSDQPRLGNTIAPNLVNFFLESGFEKEKLIIFPVFEGKRGNPVLFGRFHFPALAELQGDTGGRALIKAFPEFVREVAVDDAAILEDVDTPEDLASLS